MQHPALRIECIAFQKTVLLERLQYTKLRDAAPSIPNADFCKRLQYVLADLRNDKIASGVLYNRENVGVS